MRHLSALAFMLVLTACGGDDTKTPAAGGDSDTITDNDVAPTYVVETATFSASGSALTTTGTIAAGSNQLTLAEPLDFANPNGGGYAQGILIYGAGPGSAGWLLTSVQAGAGTTTLTVGTNATTSVTNAVVIHDDSAAIQQAIGVGQSTHMRVHLSGVSGVLFPIANTLQITSHVEVFGDGIDGGLTLGLTNFRNLELADIADGTNLLVAPSVNGINVVTDEAIDLGSFGIVYLQPPLPDSSVTALTFGGPDFVHYCDGGNIHDMFFGQPAIGVSVANCNGWHIQDNVFYNFVTYGVLTGAATGFNDWWISNNTMTAGPALQSSSAFIALTGNAAANISGNKLNAGVYTPTNISGILINPRVNGVSVEPLRITDNSIEALLTGINFYNGCPGGPIATLDMADMNPGSGGAPNTSYTGVALTGGGGTGATADITTDEGGSVSHVELVNPGTGYAVGNNLSAAAGTVGGLVNFAIIVSTLDAGGGLKAVLNLEGTTVTGSGGTFVPGSGGTPGFYSQVPLEGGSGEGASLQLTVGTDDVNMIDNGVINAGPTTLGSGYRIGDVLTAKEGSVPGLTGFSVTLDDLLFNCTVGQIAITGNQIWAGGAQADDVGIDISFFDARLSTFTSDGTITGNSLAIGGGAATDYNVIMYPSSVSDVVFSGNVFGNTVGGGTAFTGAPGNNGITGSGNVVLGCFPFPGSCDNEVLGDLPNTP